MRRGNRKAPTTVATGTAALIALAACAGGDGGNGDAPGGEGTGEDLTKVTIALPPGGWPEGDAASYLWANLLESEGYDVTLESGGDMGVIYTAVAGGDYDLFFDAWLPITHGTYLDEYGDDMERLGVWYDDARLTIAVNEDAPIASLEELADSADGFDNRIVGIEPGAGLTRITKEAVIPTYGLEGMEFVESSTQAMLAELSGAIDAGRDVVVTLWRPHWAYDAFPLRDLEDPEGTLGGAENIEVVARAGFAEDYPQLASWLEAFTLTGDQLFSLEEIMFNQNGGEDPEGSVEQWLEENPDYFASIKAAAAG
ncbi:MAG: glycine betaine ABC transporter substrate-binding protein [Actinomycetales bacterium]|nr:glycine betaine ABC transporter substrate-binding protein [Actinomycetales bacterium]